MNKLRRTVAAILNALICCAMLIISAAAQTQKQDSDQSLKIETTLVSVPVIVSDRQGRYIGGLRASDFTLYEDRVKQPIAFFADAEEPINVALLLDTSRSATWALDDIKITARDFIKQLRPQDRAMIVSFDHDTIALCELTSDRRTLERAIGDAQIGERIGTKLRDAVDAVMKEEFRTVKGRKAVVLLTDGKDHGSEVGEQTLMDSAAEADTLIYSVFYRSLPLWMDGDRQFPRGRRARRRAGRIEERNEEAMDFLRRLSEVSAGRYFDSEVSNLRHTFGLIVDELRHQYRLGFYPLDHPAGSVHSIKVEVRIEASRTDVVVRCRRSYRVAGEPQSEQTTIKQWRRARLRLTTPLIAGERRF